MFKAFIFNTRVDGEQRRVLFVGGDVVSVFTCEAIVRLFNDLRVYGLAGLVLGYMVDGFSTTHFK